MQRNTGYFPTESLEPSGNRLFSRSALNEGYLFRGSLKPEVEEDLLAEVQRLRAENAYLKELNALVAERVRQEKKQK